MICRAKDVAIFLSQQVCRHWDGFGFFDLQRLLYLAQGWHITSRNSLLFGEAIEAHRSAPLTRSVLGSVPVDEMLPLPLLSPDAKEYLVQFSRVFVTADRGAIRREVEHEEGAWRFALMAGEGAEICPFHMQSSFRMMLLKHRSADVVSLRLRRVFRKLAQEEERRLCYA